LPDPFAVLPLLTLFHCPGDFPASAPINVSFHGEESFEFNALIVFPGVMLTDSPGVSTERQDVYVDISALNEYWAGQIRL
jgi:hypothetical protein